MPNDTALFIPLKRVWFEAFRDGTKRHETRRFGSRWNATVCRVERPVILSLGYGHTRLTGRITSYAEVPARGAAARIYGEGTLCVRMGIALDTD